MSLFSRMSASTGALLLLSGAVFSGAAQAADGAELFAAQCAGCHRVDGSGVEGMYPPLIGLSGWAAQPEGRQYLADVLTHGLFGEIEVGGKRYNGGFMPTFSHLQDADLVALLRYVSETLNKPAKSYVPFDEAAITAARKTTVAGPALKAVRDTLPPR